MSDDSITLWIRRLEAGDPEAAERLWKSYFPRLVRSARWRLQRCPSRLADEEDIALSAFKSFCRATGNLHQIQDRVSLWPFLLMLVARKVSHLVRHERRAKRFGRLAEAPEGMEALMNEVPGREPPPDLVHQMTRRVPEPVRPPARRLAPHGRQHEAGGLHQRRDRRASGVRPPDGRAESSR